MSRPLNKDIQQGQQSWDADLRDDLRQLYKTPVPFPNGTYQLASGATEGTAYTSFGSLPSAGSYEGCVAAVDDGNWTPYYSDGTAWRRLVVSDGTDINTLLDNGGGVGGGDQIVGPLVTISDVKDAVKTISTKINDIISTLGLDL